MDTHHERHKHHAPHGHFFHRGYTRALLTLLIIAGIVALVAYANMALRQAQYIYSGPTTINVVGEGEMLAVPDIGQFSFSVEAEGETASDAQSESAAKINDIITYLTGEGISDRDIKTQNYNLNPRYRYEERECVAGRLCPPGEQVQDGFNVNQTVRVKVRETEKAGDLISGVGERGATNLSSLSFTVDDEDSLREEAREIAIKDAKMKAKKLAKDLDVKIIRMVGYWDEGGEMYDTFGYGGEFDMMMAEEASFRSSPSIPTGENEIKSRVNITYEVR